MPSKISIIIPAYNEEIAIKKVIEKIFDVTKGISEIEEIIVVNDGSKDKTKKILQTIKGIRVIDNPYNLGYGASIKKGMMAAKGDYILITDSDGTYPIEDIPRLVKFFEKWDMVVGARTTKSSIPLLRRPAKFFLGKVANFVVNRKIPDLNSGFRIFNKELAMKYFNLYPNGFSFTTTITLSFLTDGHTVKYLPVKYMKRKGKSSISPLRDFFGFLNLILRIATYFNPFKVFFAVSIMFLLAAVAVFAYSFFWLGRVMDITTIVFAIAAVQIFLFGLIADVVAKTRRP